MLKNDYLLAKIGFDTAENEPSKVWTCLPAPLPPLNQFRMGAGRPAEPARRAGWGTYVKIKSLGLMKIKYIKLLDLR